MSIPELRSGEQKIFFKAGDEWCYLWTPSKFEVDDPIPIVIHHHGARGYVRKSEADWLDTPSKTSYLKAVMEGGNCAIAGSHACGDHWGNQCAIEANEALLNTLDNFPSINTERVGLMGGGLGGALVWNSVTGPMIGKVKLVAVMQAVANLKAVIYEEKFKSPCLQAYGLSANTPNDEAVERIQIHNPLFRIRSLPPDSSLPKTVIYHGAKDENIPAETNAKPLEKALKKAGGEVELIIFPDVEHDVYGIGEAMEKKLKIFFSHL